MGGLSCAKEVIDNRERLIAATGCMKATVLLHQDNPPTDAERDEFLAASEALAKVAAKIQKRIESGSGGGYSHGDNDPDGRVL